MIHFSPKISGVSNLPASKLDKDILFERLIAGGKGQTYVARYSKLTAAPDTVTHPGSSIVEVSLDCEFFDRRFLYRSCGDG